MTDGLRRGCRRRGCGRAPSSVASNFTVRTVAGEQPEAGHEDLLLAHLRQLPRLCEAGLARMSQGLGGVAPIQGQGS
jgi:hypothetical protein